MRTLTRQSLSRFGTSALILVIAAVFEPSASAASRKNNRTARKPGVFLSAQGDPFPSFLGFNVGYHLSRVFQLHAGYGLSFSGSKARTIGGGIKASIPSWNTSPFVGLGYANVSGGNISYTTPLLGGGTRVIPSGTGHVYASVGLGLQNSRGFFLQGGLNYSLDDRFGGMFFASVGKFF